MTAPWTEAHRREALRRTYEIAAEQSGTDPTASRKLGSITSAHDAEDTWRGKLAYVGLDAARIAREVRRVRALAEASSEVRAMIEQARTRHDALALDIAEGRKVMETVWRGESGEEYERRDVAARDKSHGGGALTHVTRIRRAP